MLIATDGACKRNGQSTCLSVGVAWIQTEDGQMLFKSAYETCSTSQRGEINGLMESLKYAVEKAGPDEDIIIITDSEYLYNTVMLEWCHKWKNNNWIGASGDTVKNSDMWDKICIMLKKLDGRVFMQWTKGHLMSYTPGNIKYAMKEDPTGIELFMRISAIAKRESEKDRIIKDFIKQRNEHDRPPPPPEVCLDWVIANATADSLASYITSALDGILI